MAGSPKRRLALDANLLLDLAEGRDFAHDFREVFQARGYDLLVPPTAAGELDVLGTYGAEPQKSYANRALEKLPAWGCQPFWLSSTHSAIAEQFANRLVASRLIPEDEWNDGMILGETSVAGIPVLVTSDKHLLDIDEDELLLTLPGGGPPSSASSAPQAAAACSGLSRPAISARPELLRASGA